MEFVIGGALVLIAVLLLSRQGGLGSFGGFMQPGVQPGMTPAPQQPNLGTLANQTQLQGAQGTQQLFQEGAGIAGSGVGLGFGIANNSVAGIATGGIGIVAGIAVMLWTQHVQRMKDAQSENQAWNIIYPDWSNIIQQIFSAFNSGQIDANTAMAEVDTLRGLVYQDAQRFKNEPGISWSGGMQGSVPLGLTSSQRIWQVQCNKSCTIGCCLFSGVVGPNTERAKALLSGAPVAVFATGQMQMVRTSSFAVPAIPPNSTYGFNGAPSFILSVNAA